jgi:hypothetical protein
MFKLSSLVVLYYVTGKGINIELGLCATIDIAINSLTERAQKGNCLLFLLKRIS